MKNSKHYKKFRYLFFSSDLANQAINSGKYENLINKTYQEQSELKYTKKLTRNEIGAELEDNIAKETIKYYETLEQAHKASLKPHKDDLYETYDVDEEFAYKARRTNLKNQLNEIDEKICDSLKLLYKHKNKEIPQWFLEIEKEDIEKLKEKYYKLQNKIHWLKQPYCPSGQNGQNFDLEKIKAVEIKQVLEHYNIEIINEFFKLRDEKTASVKIYYDSNTYWDFGASEGGDNISLVMKLDDCNFQEALQTLNRYI